MFEGAEAMIGVKQPQAPASPARIRAMARQIMPAESDREWADELRRASWRLSGQDRVRLQAELPQGDD